MYEHSCLYLTITISSAPLSSKCGDLRIRNSYFQRSIFYCRSLLNLSLSLCTLVHRFLKFFIVFPGLVSLFLRSNIILRRDTVRQELAQHRPRDCLCSILLRINPATLTLVAGFLINMLISHTGVECYAQAMHATYVPLAFGAPRSHHTDFALRDALRPADQRKEYNAKKRGEKSSLRNCGHV